MITDLYTNDFPVLSINAEFCLRQPHEKDAETLCAYYQNDEIGQYIMASDPNTLAEAKAELAYNRNITRSRRGIFWAIARKDNDEMIGSVGLYTNNFHHRAELCYDLSRDYWRQGIMTQALQAVLDFCFRKAGFMRIEAVTRLENEASQNILLKMGFEFDSIMKNYRYYEGQFFDVKMFSITPAIWAQTEFAQQKAAASSADEAELIDKMFQNK